MNPTLYKILFIAALVSCNAFGGGQVGTIEGSYNIIIGYGVGANLTSGSGNLIMMNVLDKTGKKGDIFKKCKLLRDGSDITTQDNQVLIGPMIPSIELVKDIDARFLERRHWLQFQIEGEKMFAITSQCKRVELQAKKGVNNVGTSK
jgi:hypothetical protein